MDKTENLPGAVVVQSPHPGISITPLYPFTPTSDKD